MHNKRFFNVVDVVNGSRKRRFSFNIEAETIKAGLKLALWRNKILVPMCSALFYLILLAHTMVHDARRLFRLSR
jgi:hypothetical protein